MTTPKPGHVFIALVALIGGALFGMSMPPDDDGTLRWFHVVLTFAGPFLAAALLVIPSVRLADPDKVVPLDTPIGWYDWHYLHIVTYRFGIILLGFGLGALAAVFPRHLGSHEPVWMFIASGAGLYLGTLLGMALYRADVVQTQRTRR